MYVRHTTAQAGAHPCPSPSHGIESIYDIKVLRPVLILGTDMIKHGHARGSDQAMVDI